jgi:hypothetical protein
MEFLKLTDLPRVYILGVKLLFWVGDRMVAGSDSSESGRQTVRTLRERCQTAVHGIARDEASPKQFNPPP